MTARNLEGTAVETFVVFSMHQVLEETMDLNRPVKPSKVLGESDMFDIRMKIWPVKQEE